MIPPCDVCRSIPIVRVGHLGQRPDRRVWLCLTCFERFEDHELMPNEILALVRRVAERHGKCDWCRAAPPAANVRIKAADGSMLAFSLCSMCAREARDEEGAQVLHAQAARDGEIAVDPRYERARDVASRRRQMRRVK